jgi:hypothetical protein
LDAEQITPTKKEPEPMTNREIIHQLLDGNHLEPKELQKAWLIVEDLKEILEYRTAGEAK